ncbi:SusC/RagA family TonB-linked outer membrane protein [Balneolaceae bacterium ANBcel3]|nr:SusC/RagA family TonB-linked outer membrane protein [Balneolaceae bacterium ANBcel3]
MFRKVLSLAIFAAIFIPTSVLAQVGSLAGTITDRTTGEELPGATVFFPDLDRGTATGINGQYLLSNIPEGDYVIRITYVGYETIRQNITIEPGENVLDIQMTSDFLGLDEMVVTGVGFETATRQLGTNVVSVSGRDLTQVPAYTFDSALAGKIAGGSITPAGAPGAPSSIVLRGINTMGISRPLIMVDGVEIDASNFNVGGNQDQISMLANIDFNDVERVEVVKGAAAATLYGAQGANGVIQIFTRSGERGPMRVSASTSWSFDRLNTSRQVNLAERHSYPVDADGYITGGMSYNDETGFWTIPSIESVSGSSPLNDREYIGFVDPDGNQVPMQLYDNVEAFFDGGLTQNHRLSISGGDENYNYLIAGSYMDQEGVEQDIGFERLAVRLNTDIDLRSDLRLGLRNSFINSKRTGVTESGNNIQSGLNFMMTLPPFIDATWTDANGYYPPTVEEGSISTHGLFFKQISHLEAETNRLTSSANLNYSPFSFLEIDYRLGLDYYYLEFDRLQENAERFNNALIREKGYFERNAYTNRMLNSILDVFVRRNIGNDLNLGLPIQSTSLLKFDWRETQYNRMTSRADEMPPGLGLETISSGSIPEVEEYRQTFVTYGFLFNQKFDIDEYGGFSLGIRGDKSSAFGEGAEYSWFPRGDAYLRLSEFTPQFSHILREFKLRAAYGEAGTQPGAYQRFVTLNQGLIGSFGYFATPATASNAMLTVVESRELELGADLAFRFGQNWFNSVGLGVTYWTRENDGAIESLEAPLSIGANAILDNTIDLESDGFDITLDALVYNTRDISWFAKVNFGMSQTTVTHIANGEDLILEAPGGKPFIFREGAPYGAFFGRKPVQSLDQRDADGEYYIAEMVTVTENGESVQRPREEIYTVYSGHVVNKRTKAIQWVDEQVIIGDPTPDFILSLRNDITIRRNFNLAFQLDWQHGGEIFNDTRWWMYNSATHSDFDNKVLIDGGEVAGEPLAWNTDVVSRFDGSEPQAYYNYHWTKRNGPTSFFVEDASYLKLREITISYDFAELFGLRQGNIVQNLILGVSGRNLLTFTNYSGFDPDVSQAGQDVRYRGLDTFTYPNYRTFSFNASVNF